MGDVKVVPGPPMQQTPDLHNKPAQGFIGPPYTAPAGWKIREAHLSGCLPTSGDAGECQFNFGVSCPTNADATSVQCTMTVGSHPHTNLWSITIVQQKPTAIPLPLITYNFPSNQNVNVDMPEDADATTLIGSAAAGKPFRIALKPYSASATDPVYCPNPPVPALAGGITVSRFTCTAAAN